jgi:hypothetical protein
MIQALIGPVAGLLDKFVEDKDQKNALAHEIATLATRQAHENAMMQMEINKAEAASASVFKGGWRPATGWLIVIVLAWTYLVQPFAVFVLTVLHYDLPPLPELDTNALMPILLGMLGLTASRSFEKAKGVASK